MYALVHEHQALAEPEEHVRLFFMNDFMSLLPQLHSLIGVYSLSSLFDDLIKFRILYDMKSSPPSIIWLESNIW